MHIQMICDLDATQRFRSPWSGNRIPLHSLVHAGFVYFVLLALWCRLARTIADPVDVAAVQDRIARNLFGYAFLPAIIEHPDFPIARVEPAILDAMRRMARVAREAELDPPTHGRLADALRVSRDDAWLVRLEGALAGIAPVHRAEAAA